MVSVSFSPFDIDILRRNFCSDYLSFYKNLGFEVLPPLPLRIHFDPSLTFTSCSICLFKKMYFEGIEPQKYCVIQPSFRTNTYKEIHSGESLQYTASLTISGTFSPTDRQSLQEDFERAVLWQAEFLSHHLRAGQMIRLTLPKQLVPLISWRGQETLLNFSVQIVQDDEGLVWTYGMGDIVGVGTRWEIVSGRTYYNWGNVIVIYRSQEPIGIESGGSLEVALQGILELPHKIFANQYCGAEMAAEMIQSTPMLIKYFDVLDVIATILWETRAEAILPLQLSAVLEQYVRAFKCLTVLMKIDRGSYQRYAVLYERSHPGWSQHPGLLCRKMQEKIFSQWSMSVLTAGVARKERHHWRNFSPLEREAIPLAAAHPELLWFEPERRRI